jgi:hypothetical protein
VHAADDLSVMESLEALPHVVRSARAMIGGQKGYRVGPSTIGMRHNPYGARVTPNPANRRVTMVESDPRQASLFAAAWMIGYVAATAEAALQTLTVGSLTGCLGLARVHASGELLRHPAFYAARGLAELGGNLRYQCHSSLPGSVAAVAGVDREGRPVLWLANLTGQKQEVVLQGNHQANSVLLMDELGFTGHGAAPWHQRETLSAQPVPLLPYAVACLQC